MIPVSRLPDWLASLALAFVLRDGDSFNLTLKSALTFEQGKTSKYCVHEPTPRCGYIDVLFQGDKWYFLLLELVDD